MYFRILTLLAIISLTGCASNPMMVAPQQELQTPSTNESQVIFMRSSFVGSAISASLYEVTNDKIIFIGVIANNTKLSYKTTPGKHTFMVVSEAADFMESNLNSGKNYYSIVTPRMGIWKARFSLWPIKNDPEAEFHTQTSDFNDWVTSTKLVNNTNESRAWYEGNKDSVKQKYQEYWPEWQSKTNADLLKRTLSPQDGL